MSYYFVNALKILLRFLAAAAVLCAAALAAEGLYRAVLFLDRAPLEKRGAFQLYALGGSTTCGVPFYKPIPYLVSALLGGELAGRPVNVINLAEGGQSIYPQAVKTIRLLKYRDPSVPAALLIYSGHNEAMNPSSRSTRSSRLCEAFKRRVLIHSLLFGGLAVRLERSLNLHGERNPAHYEFYLRAVIKAALESGVTPVISTLAANTSGAEPSGADFSPELGQAVALELRGEYKKALARYDALLAAAAVRRKDEGGGNGGAKACSFQPAELTGPDQAQALLAYLDYRKGRCLQALGRPGQARPLLLAALERDPLQFRARPSQNRLLRALAAEYGVPLVDSEKLLADLSPGGLPGGNVFADLMHPSEDGYFAIARAFCVPLLERFHGRLSPGIVSPDRIPPSPLEAPLPPGHAYIRAGIFLIWFMNGGAPIPDRLALAEKNFRKALELSPGNNLALVWLRTAVAARKNGARVPEDLCRLLAHRSEFLEGRLLSAAEAEDADRVLRGRPVR